MGNFSWTNFKPFVIIYLVLCILGYFLSPGIQPNIKIKKENIKNGILKDSIMIYNMYFDEELIALKKQIEIDSARDNNLETLDNRCVCGIMTTLDN